jgi:hypothetical protein
MIKKIASTINPDTNKPYSIYTYDAIMKVVNGTGNFVHVNGEDLSYRTNSFGATFSKGLIEGLLGLTAGAGALSFAEGMISAIGNLGLSLLGWSKARECNVGNIFFICEYIQGLTTISAVVVSCDAKANKQVFTLGPCYKESSISTMLTMHKDVYMFSPSKSKTE